MEERCHNTYIESFPWKLWTSMLKKRNGRRREGGMGKEGAPKSEREWQNIDMRWGRARHQVGLKIRRADEENEIKGGEQEKKGDTDTCEFPKDQDEGRREGIKQGSVYICLVMFSRVNTRWLNELPLRMHVLPKPMKTNRILCVNAWERCQWFSDLYLMQQTGGWPRLTRECVCVCVCLCRTEAGTDKQQLLQRYFPLSAETGALVACQLKCFHPTNTPE